MPVFQEARFCIADWVMNHSIEWALHKQMFALISALLLLWWDRVSIPEGNFR